MSNPSQRSTSRDREGAPRGRRDPRTFTFWFSLIAACGGIWFLGQTVVHGVQDPLPRACGSSIADSDAGIPT